MSFDRARAIADAVLFEGYVLYPYRASSAKNRYRWAFGVLSPRSWSEAGGCEPWALESQTLLESMGATRVEGRLRFLQAQVRTVEATDDGGATFRPVDALEVATERLVPWEEGEVREIDFTFDVAGRAGAPPLTVPFTIAAGAEVQEVRGPTGVIGRLVRTRREVRGALHLSSEWVAGERPLLRLTVRVENVTPFADAKASREDAVRSGCIATHLMLSTTKGAFLSLLDPPEWARAAVGGCRNVGTYPVLAGEEGRRDLVLSAPIVLYDHPQVAPESHGDFFDSTEIDEILTLRTLTLTEEEKREARGTDERAARIVERVGALPPELMDRLHGAIRDVRNAEMVPREQVSSDIAVGTRVRLKPGARRTDAQDLLYEGCIARVEDVKHDVDGRVFLAVTIEGDPAAELHRAYGRFHYYELDEVELLPEGEGGQG